MKKPRAGIFHVSLLQFLFFAAYGAGVPYLGLYYRSVLVDASGTPDYSAVGMAFFLSLLVGIISPLIAGYLADRFKIQHRLISLLGFLVFAGGILFSLPGLPFFAGMSFTWRLVLILTGSVITGLFVRPLMPLMDSETLNTLHSHKIDRSKYGEVRLFGSLGWIVTAALVGYLLLRFNRISIAPIGYTLGFLMLGIFGSSRIKPRIAPVKIPWNHLKSDRALRHFLVFVSILAIGMTGGYVFTGIFFADVGASYLIMGLAFSLSSLPEIPILFYGRRLLERLGNRKLIIIGSAIQGFKFFLLFLVADMDAAVLFVFILLLQGAGYSFYLAGSVNFLDQRAHKDLRSTYQSLFHLVFTLFGAFGTLLGSFITETFSSRTLMAVSAIFIGIATLYVAIFLGSGSGRKKERESVQR